MKKIISLIIFVVLVLALSVTAFAEKTDEKEYDPLYAKIIASGHCGAENNGYNIRWFINEYGDLVLSGPGKMVDYDYLGFSASTSPWADYNYFVKTLTIHVGMTNIGDYAFFRLENLRGKLEIPDGIVTIGDHAFDGCSGFTGNLVIPKSVKYIRQFAFENCSGFTGDVIIPGSVILIEKGAFGGTSNVNNLFVFEDNNSYCSKNGILYTKNKKEIVACPGGKSGFLEIPENVTTIGEYAFSGCDKFTGDLIIPNSVTVIEDGAFDNCDGFSGNLILSENVTTIGNFAFNFCEKLTGKLVFPSTVKTIGNGAFSFCGIDEYYFKGDAPSVYDALDYRRSFDKDVTIYYPENNATWIIENGKWNGYTAKPWKADIVYGDVDGNEKINVLDANLIRRYTAKLEELDDIQLKGADVDSNGKVNVLDANLIRRYSAKLIDKFPAEG
ncbi:MAG: leucine-rich repeat protein [Oscillospiraceae bacterium]|nr:leucine-rich repeat protein [Oscillospiraceae bacterium]